MRFSEIICLSRRYGSRVNCFSGVILRFAGGMSQKNAVFSHPFFLRDYLRLDTVHWCLSYITLCQSSRDVMSFWFSGCIMARNRLRDTIYVAHVHCDKEREYDCRRDFAMFLKEIASDITRLQVFQPGAGIWSHCANDIPDGMVRCL